MILEEIYLKNFRNYESKKFPFDPHLTVIIGVNTAGKTNLIEAIYFLATGKSFKADKDEEAIQLEEEIGRIKAKIESGDRKVELEILLSNPKEGKKTLKKYLVNGVSKKRADFLGNLVAVLFSPEDLDIIIDSPSLRRRFLDEVLEQTDFDYRRALIAFTKGLRQRNALLEKAREEGGRNERLFEYWDNLLIENGNIITEKRAKFIDYVNQSEKRIFDFVAFYDKSTISKARLEQYKEAELASGVTLVGPHRDDFSLSMFNNKANNTHDIKLYGSRGQQRLAILQLRLLQFSYIEKELGFKPILLLDDIFSELDEGHINEIMGILGKQQTIITTTHKEFIPKPLLNKIKMIEINK